MPKNRDKLSDTSPPGSKGAFIRKHADKTVKEIVELGKQAGIPIKTSFVYNIRSADKKATGKPQHKKVGKTAATAANGKTTTKPRPRLAVSAPTHEVDASVKSQVRTFVLRVGLDRASQVFEQVLSDLKREIGVTSN